MHTNMIETRELMEDHLRDLVSGKILALIIPDYYPKAQARALSQNILANRAVEQYTHELKEEGQVVQKYFGVDRLGFPFNATYNAKPGDAIIDQYYEEAKAGIARMRELAEGAITPIDKLRLNLDEVFTEGATVAAFAGRKMLAGIGRITKAELSHLSADQPHYDALPEKIAKLDAQLAANIYLNVPDEGGELEVWNVDPLKPLSETPEDWRAVLPTSILIKPKVGDLIIFNCRRPHAVQSFHGDDRVTVQMFIGYQVGAALQLWN